METNNLAIAIMAAGGGAAAADCGKACGIFESHGLSEFHSLPSIHVIVCNPYFTLKPATKNTAISKIIAGRALLFS